LGFWKSNLSIQNSHFVLIIFSKKMQKNCIFVRFSTFSKNELKKWNLCMISNWYKKLMRIATHLNFFLVKAESLYFSTKLRVLLFNKKTSASFKKNARLNIEKIAILSKIEKTREKRAFCILAPWRYQKWKTRIIFYLELTGFVLKARFDW